ncbi:unknown [Prevotella sp. CAG:1185]|nr:unknown [Prevotella sp. CAG:1185]
MLLNVTENIVFVTFCVKFYLKRLNTVMFRLLFVSCACFCYIISCMSSFLFMPAMIV